jgi:glutamate-1-semialdehyde 2,1-aminomutase
MVSADSYAALAARVSTFGDELQQVLGDALAAAGTTDAEGRPLSARVPVVGPLFGIFFVPVGEPDVRDYAGASASAATGLYARFFRSMLERGVALAPGPYEVAFPSMAHGDVEYDRALACATEAIAETLAP